MPKVTNYDTLIFFYCVLAGVALSLLADIFRAMRKYMKFCKPAIFISDFLFFVIAALVTFYMQFVYSNGSVRYFILLGIICGFLSARVVISPLCNKLFGFVNRIVNAVLKPAKKLFAAVLQKSVLFCKKIFKKVRLFEKNILKSIGKLVYNIINVVFRRKTKNTRKSKVKAEKSVGKKKKKR